MSGQLETEAKEGFVDQTGDQGPEGVVLSHADRDAAQPLDDQNFNDNFLSTEDEFSASEEASLIRVLPADREGRAHQEEEEEEGEEDGKGLHVYACGFGKFQPKYLQIFARAKFFTFLLCVFTLTEGAIVSGFRTIVVSTLERRYHFSSTASSVVLATYDIAVIVSVVFISHFGHKSHKPRILGIGVLLHGIGALLYAAPQLLLGSYAPESSSGQDSILEACAPNVTDQFISSHCSPSNYGAYFFLLIGAFIMGLGASPLFTIGTSYIDDIVYPKYVSVHLGIVLSMALIGPAIGYGLGGAFLSVYVDPWEATERAQSDPSWVGAWWLCFILGGGFAIILSVPFLMFPRLLPDSHLVRQERAKEMAHGHSGKKGEESFRSQLKAFPVQLKKLCKNASWVLLTLGLTCLFFSFDGMVQFGPKYLEAQFGFTSSNASLTLGALAVGTGALGVLTGALLVFLVKSKGSRVANINWIVGLMAVLPILGSFLVSCPDVAVVGVTTPYANASSSDGGDVTLSRCNLPCNCSSTVFEPVCGADGLTYFSPCRAGCQKYFDSDNEPFFENCSCVADNLQELQSVLLGSATIDVLLGNSTAEDSQCPQSCDKLPVFLVSVGLAVYLVLILKIPSLIITLRCVSEEQRTLALGAQSLVFRAFGSVPGPLLFGVLFDSACSYWEQSTECGVQGHCWLYSRRGLSVRALSIALSGMVANFIFSFFAWVFYPRKRTSRVEEEEEEEGGRDSIELQAGSELSSEQLTAKNVSDNESETEELLSQDRRDHTEL